MRSVRMLAGRAGALAAKLLVPPAFVGEAHSVSAAGTTWSVAIPACNVGDVLVGIVTGYNLGSANSLVLSAAGWTAFLSDADAPHPGPDAAGNGLSFTCYWKIATSADNGTSTFNGTKASGSDTIAAVTRYTASSNPSNPISQAWRGGIINFTVGTVGAMVAPSITPAAAPVRLIVPTIAFRFGTAGETIVVQSPLVTRLDVASGTDLIMNVSGDRAPGAGAATSTYTNTLSANSTGGSFWGVAAAIAIW